MVKGGVEVGWRWKEEEEEEKEEEEAEAEEEEEEEEEGLFFFVASSTVETFFAAVDAPSMKAIAEARPLNDTL